MPEKSVLTGTVRIITLMLRACLKWFIVKGEGVIYAKKLGKCVHTSTHGPFLSILNETFPVSSKIEDT